MTLEEIGENETALLCMTNLTSCCESNLSWTDSLEDWFFPNGTGIGDAEGVDFYTTRGHMVIGLNRRSGGVDGIYRCDSRALNQSIYIGVYTASDGK